MINLCNFSKKTHFLEIYLMKNLRDGLYVCDKYILGLRQYNICVVNKVIEKLYIFLFQINHNLCVYLKKKTYVLIIQN